MTGPDGGEGDAALARALGQTRHAEALIDEIVARLFWERCWRRQAEALLHVAEALREAERELHEGHECPCGCGLEGPVGGSAVGR